MSVTVDDLLTAHRECLAAADEVRSVSDLYPIEGVPFETALYEAALRSRNGARSRLKQLMSDADRDTVEQAKRRAKEEA